MLRHISISCHSPRKRILRSKLVLYLLKSSGPFRRLHKNVHSTEAGLQRRAVLPRFELFKLDQLLAELLFDPYTDLFASVAIEDPEAADAVGQIRAGDVSVLLRLTPTLHRGRTPSANVTHSILRLFSRVRCAKIWSHSLSLSGVCLFF